MNNYEFISYEKTPEDGLQLGIATIMACGKLMLKYKHMQNKDGSGTYFAASSVCTTTNGQKQYTDSVMIDSRHENEMLMNLLRQSISKLSYSDVAPSAFSPAPNQVTYQKLANQEQFPF